MRLTLVLKLASLLQGFSGVSEELARFLERLINAQLLPCVPAQGSVGAFGRPGPARAPVTARARARRDPPQRRGAARRRGPRAGAGSAPLALGPKEGLALLNGTQVSTALALAGLFELETVFAAAVVSGTLSLDALAGR